MNISRVSSQIFNNYRTHFGNAVCLKRDNHTKNADTDKFVSRRFASTIDIADYLNGIGIKTNIRNDKYLEISGLNKFNDAVRDYKNAMQININAILPYVKKVTGSVDFGANGINSLGSIEELKGTIFAGRRFDFSTSDIKSLGNLEKIDGIMVINPKQLRDLEFEGLDVTGDIIISKTCSDGTIKTKKLDSVYKAALLGGFELLTY